MAARAHKQKVLGGFEPQLSFSLLEFHVFLFLGFLFLFWIQLILVLSLLVRWLFTWLFEILFFLHEGNDAALTVNIHTRISLFDQVAAGNSLASIKNVLHAAVTLSLLPVEEPVEVVTDVLLDFKLFSHLL